MKPSSGSHYTPSEILAALQALSDTDLKKFIIASINWEIICGISAEDLRQQACVRLMENSCNKKYCIVHVLLGILRSLASGKGSRLRNREIAVDTMDDRAEPMWSTTPPNPEQILLLNEEKTELLKELHREIANKPHASSVLDASLVGYRGKERRDHLGLTEKQDAAAQKAILRGIEKVSQQVEDANDGR